MIGEQLQSATAASLLDHNITDCAVILGVSGGADSMVLLQTIVRLKEQFQLRPHVVHINHELRGSESDADAEFVRNHAKELSVACTVVAVQTAPEAQRSGLGIEAAARELRYNAFLEVANSINARWVFTAHTLDDSVETILMNLARGSGLRGLGGIPVARGLSAGVSVIRPFLSLRRNMVRETALQWGVAWREDASNASTDFLRNEVRHTLVPAVRHVFGPSVDERIARSARIIQKAEKAISHYAGQIASDVVRTDGSSIRLNTVQLEGEPRAVVEELLRELLMLRHTDINNVYRLFESEVGSKVVLSGNRIAVRERGEITFRLEPPAESTDSIIIGEPGTYVVDDTTLQIVIGSDRPAVFPGNTSCIVLDAASVHGPLEWTLWRDGDRFQPFGMDGTVLVSDLLTNVRVPHHIRRSVRVVRDTKGILWVCGIRQAERTRVTANTSMFMTMSVQP